MSNLGPQFSRADRAWGSGNPEALFGDGLQTPAPWPRAGRRKTHQDYDQDLVKQTLQTPPKLEAVDPRTLHATQPNVTRPGVDYYMGDQYRQTGETFADHHNVGNHYPVVYEREDGAKMLLSGHHRAAAALLKGEPLLVRKIEGPWGKKRGE